MSAVALVVLAGMIGGGVDMSRAYMVQNRLQNACDAGVLAGRRAVNADGYTTAAQNRADNFFDTNFDEANEGVSETSFVSTTPDNGNTVNGVATTTVDTVVVRLFGYDDVPLSVECTASMSVGNSDVVMVLDVTGSMGGTLGGQTRLQALKGAMKSFYDTVDSAAAGGNSRIRFGFVPYSSGVNVGQLLYNQDPKFLADSHAYQSKKAVFEDVEVNEFSGWGDPYTTEDNNNYSYDYDDWYYHTGSYRKKNDCENNQPNDTSWSVDGAASTTTVPTYINSGGQRVSETRTSSDQTRTEYDCYKAGKKNYWVIRRTVTRTDSDIVYSIEDPIYTTTTTTSFDRWSYEEVVRDTSTFKTFAATSTPTGPDGTAELSTWDGCVEERDTESVDTFSFSSIFGITPSGALDLDVDLVPTVADSTKWKPSWHQISYRRTNSSGSSVTSAQSDYGTSSSLNGYYACPKQSQLLSTMTEAEFDGYTDSLSAGGNTYHNIGMIWGVRLASPDGIFSSNVNEAPSNGGDVARHVIFMSDGAMLPHTLVYSPYGIEKLDKRVTDDGSSDHSSRHTKRFIAACDIAKSKGIRVWVIAFATGLTPDLQDCASDDSAFTAANATQLNDAFQEIAKDVGELRITQ